MTRSEVEFNSEPKLDYLKMLESIDVLVNNDFMFDMQCKNISRDKKFTQKEAQEMERILGKVYLISHCLTCKSCSHKYEV